MARSERKVLEDLVFVYLLSVELGWSRVIEKVGRFPGVIAKLSAVEVPRVLDLARLLIDVAETLPLLAILEQAGCSHDENSIDADYTEHGREDIVDEDIGKGRDGGCTASHKSSSCRARACRVRHESG